MTPDTADPSALQKIVIIAGPTATGKTPCAIELALSLGGEIVNCDSRQVYRSMDIGTAKPDREQLTTVPHAMIDVVDPSVRFSSAQYVTMADACISDMTARGKVPFVTGGTGFYIKALLHGLAPIPPLDDAVREDIRSRQRLEGNDALFEELKRVDPEDAARIRKNDTYRLVRALEVFTATGRPLYGYTDEHRFTYEKYAYLYIILHDPDKIRYHAAIDQRVDGMIARGLVDEAQWLLRQGYSPDLPSMKTVGYREIFDYLNQGTDLATAAGLIKQHTRAYAKRQVTWFKGIKNAIWINMHDSKDRIQEIIKGFIYAKNTERFH